LTVAEVNGSSYGQTIKDQLTEERATKSSLEARGIGIVTSSGTLATLLFGIVAFTRGTNNQLHWEISTNAKYALVASVALFALAALLGLAANFPGDYKEADVDKLRERTGDEWKTKEPVEAARRDAVLYVNIIAGSRVVNAKKAQAVRWGIAAEALATVAVAAAVVLEIWGI
jgi:hypothetical protein